MNFVERHVDSRIVKAAFWSAGLLALIMALLPHPPHVPGGLNDKVQHAAAFASLALLGFFGYSRLSAVRLVIALSAFGALIEVLQQIPSLHRDSDVLDWLADTVACAAVIVALHWWKKRKQAL